MDKKDLNNEDVLLKLAADALAKDVDENDIPIDKEILKMCMDYDDKQRKKKAVYSVLSKVAIAVFAAFLSFEVFMPETAEAFHTRVFNLIFDDNSGSVSLNNEGEYELIGDWTDYHYPEYVPEGFELTGAQKREFDSVLLYQNLGENIPIRIIERSLDYSSSFDTDSTEIYEVKVNVYDGYIFIGTDYDSLMLTWIQDNKQICITTTQELSQDEVIKMGENLKYIE